MRCRESATAFSGGSDYRRLRRAFSVASVLPQTAELIAKLKQVEANAWMLYNELPPCGARIRALHVFLDAKEIKTRLETLPRVDEAGDG